MKIWRGYGSDHSANLVMIGVFRSETDAKKAEALLAELITRAQADLEADHIDWDADPDGFTPETKTKLRSHDLLYVSPKDISDFANTQHSIESKGAKLTIRTDDVDIGAFVKLLVEKGARVEVYSTDEYPDAESEGDSNGNE